MRIYEINSDILNNLDSASEEKQIAAVTDWAPNISYIQRPSEKVQLAAVQKSPDIISSIKNPSEKVQLAAISKYVTSIVHIKYPTPKVQATALATYPAAIVAPLNWTPSVIDKFKAPIITVILNYMKHGHNDNARSMVKVLSDLGMRWPEISVMQKSLAAS